MARLKKKDFMVSLGSGLGTVTMTVVFNVSTSGEFYCSIPEEAKPYFEDGKVYDGIKCRANRAGALSLYSKSLDSLDDLLILGLKASHEPTVIEEHVILYNIESHISFAENEAGQVFPNAGFEDAEWPKMNSEKSKMLGGHHAGNKCTGGYSLTIGAQAMTKITSTVGDKISIKYERYYKGDGHLTHNNPATLLNSWVAFDLPKEPREMPYTDEAAMFFHNLMLGMAKLSKQIQEATFDSDNIQNLISSSSSNLLKFSK